MAATRAVAPAAPKAQSALWARGPETAQTSATTRGNMVAEASTMATAHAPTSLGVSFARPLKVSVTAVDEANPPSRPVTPKPRRAPKTRMAM